MVSACFLASNSNDYAQERVGMLSELMYNSLVGLGGGGNSGCLTAFLE